VARGVKVTEEYAAWFTALIKDDLASATQAGQAVGALREHAQRVQLWGVRDRSDRRG
jgi:hypothetical protein